MKVEKLVKGTVLDDRDPAVQDIIREEYNAIPINPARVPGMFGKLRTVMSVQINRTYVYISFESYAVIRRPKGYEVGVRETTP